MTAYQTMKEAIAKLDEVKGQLTPLTMKYKQAADAHASKLSTNGDLSPKGKETARLAFKAQQGEKFIADMKRLRSDYDSAVVKAEVNAEVLLNQSAPKPADTAIKTFHRQLAELETALLLEVDADKALGVLNDFIIAQSNPYMAQQVKAEIPSLIGQVVGLAGADAPRIKGKLKDTVATLNQNAYTDEQREAAEVFETVGKRYGENLYSPASIQMQALTDAVGYDAAKYANNPAAYIAKPTTDTNEV